MSSEDLHWPDDDTIAHADVELPPIGQADGIGVTLPPVEPGVLASIEGLPPVDHEIPLTLWDRWNLLRDKLTRAANVGNFLYYCTELISLIKKGAPMNSKSSVIVLILTALLTILATFHVLPGVTTENASEVAMTLATAGASVWGAIMVALHGQNKDRAIEAAKTTGGLPPDMK